MNLKFYTADIEVQTHNSFEYIDVTQTVQEEILKSKTLNGIVVVNLLHTTAALVLQEGDPTVHKDAKMVLENLIPTKAAYSHSYEGSVNGAAHQRQQTLGAICVLAIVDGNLKLGTWQHIFLVELFRPMRRHIQVTVFGN